MWDAYTVVDRVKLYEASVQKKNPAQDKANLIAHSRNAAADRWLFSFREATALEARIISLAKGEPF